jgi:SH3-like domain-containing protein
LKADPTDKDIRFNLELANSRVIDKIEPLPEFFLKSWWRGVRDISSGNGWAWQGVFAFCLTLAAAFLFFVSGSVLLRKISFWTGLVLLAFTIAAFVFSASSYRQYQRQDSAIIFAPTVTVKSSPNDNSIDLFVIHEGAKVFILDSVEGWSEIKLANGNVGWLKSTVYRPI